jgi:hypothetical protein
MPRLTRDLIAARSLALAQVSDADQAIADTHRIRERRFNRERLDWLG